jgi:hypothetical protein
MDTIEMLAGSLFKCPPSERHARFGMTLFGILTKILHFNFLEEVYYGKNCAPQPPARSRKKSGLCHSYGTPALIRQLISNVRRIPRVILAVIGFDSSQPALAYDVPHNINSFPVFCIHYNIRKGLCQALTYSLT